MKFFGWKQRCQELQAQNQQLQAENQQLRERIAWLEARLREVEAQVTRLTQSLAAAQKHSGNSSKPPSSDIVKPASQQGKKKSKRRIGGQPGHPQHERPPFAADQVKDRIAYRLKACPVDASHRIRAAEGTEHQRTLQQIELLLRAKIAKVLITEQVQHRQKKR